MTRAYGRETLDLYAPLANRLGIWQLKWELEDLSFRFLEPETYKRIAKMLEEKRMMREGFVQSAIARLKTELAAAGIKAEVFGRPKHIYSIWNKMRGKELDFTELYDVRAFRVIVDDDQDLLRRAGHGAQYLDADPEGIRRLYFAAQAERLPVAAHGGDGRRRPAAGSADPHQGNAQLCRVRRCRALALQGRGRLELQGPEVRRENRLAAPAAGLEDRRGRCRGRPGRPGGNPARVGGKAQVDHAGRPHLRADAAGARAGIAGRRHADRFCLPPAQRSGPPLPRRPGRRRRWCRSTRR